MRPRLLAVVVLATATLSPLVVGLAGANYVENPGWPRKKRFSTKTKPYTPKKYKDLGLVDKLSAIGRSIKGIRLTPS